MASVIIRIGKNKLPNGRTVALFSASHLADVVGTVAYTLNMANQGCQVAVATALFLKRGRKKKLGAVNKLGTWGAVKGP